VCLCELKRVCLYSVCVCVRERGCVFTFMEKCLRLLVCVREREREWEERD